MSYVDIANEESSDIQADGEDYYVALRNLENKYGYDEDIVTIIRMCNQWQNSFHKMQGRCNEFIMATTSYEARIKSILENKTEPEVFGFNSGIILSELTYLNLNMISESVSSMSNTRDLSVSSRFLRMLCPLPREGM